MNATYMIEHLEEAIVPTYVQIEKDILVKYFDMGGYRYEVILNEEAGTVQFLVFNEGELLYKDEKEADGENEVKLFKDLDDLYWNEDAREELQCAIFICGLKPDMKIFSKEN